jgi:hypothetical protein
LKKEHAKHDGLLSRTKSELEKARAAQQAKKEHESTLERILGVSSTDRCSTKVKVTLILERIQKEFQEESLETLLVQLFEAGRKHISLCESCDLKG